MRLALLLFVLAAPAVARAQTPEPDRFVFFGMSGGLGMELSGMKLFVGYNYGRGDVKLEFTAGGSLIPVGGGAGLSLNSKFYILDDPTWRAGPGLELGVKFGTPIVPVVQIYAEGAARKSIFGASLTLKTGVPQVFGASLAGSLSLGRSTTWVGANLGVPFFFNGEVGYTRGLF